MASRRKCWWALTWAVLLTVVALLGLMPRSSAGNLPSLSLSYSVAEGGYNNSVRVASMMDILYPRIAVDQGEGSPRRGTIYVLGLDGRVPFPCPPIVVSRSFDGGRTFEAPRRANPLCANGRSLSVGIDRNGTLFAAGWGPVIARSSDGGQTWATVATIDQTNSSASLAVDPATDEVYIVWGPLDRPWHFTPGPLLVSVSRDGGANWSSPREILPGGSTGVRPHVAAFSGFVVVAFTTNGTADRHVAAVASADNGRGWGDITNVAPPDPCEMAHTWPDPSIAASPTGVFAVTWTADTGRLGCSATWGTATEIWTAVSRDNGRTFSTPARAAGPPAWTAATFGGAIAFDDASRMYLTWHSIAPDWTGTVYAASSTDLSTFDSASFTLRLRESGGNATAQENLAAGRNGTMYLVWEVDEDPSNPSNTTTGIFVRAIAGEATGDIVLNESPEGSVLVVEIRDPARSASAARLRWTGSRLTVSSLPPGTYEVWLVADSASGRAGSMPLRAWGVTSFTLLVGEAPVAGTPWLLPTGAAFGLAVLGAALAGVYHTRLGREEILQRKVRSLMFEYVRDNPGASFTAIRDALGLQNGVASYHLSVLEKEGLIHSESRRRHCWYYPDGDVSLWRDIPLSPVQSAVVDQLRRSPGIGVREIARASGHRASSVAYNVKALAREGILRVERSGRKLRCFCIE